MNSLTTPIESALLSGKLRVLADKLKAASNPYGSSEYQTLEELLQGAYKIISTFYKDLSSPVFKNDKPAIKYTDPDPEDYTEVFEQINMDIEVIFAEFENLESVLLGNFNYMVSRLNRLMGRLKQASSRLGDFYLYSKDTDRRWTFFTDSFANLERIEVNSPLLQLDQLEIHQDEGLLTLPLDAGKQKLIQISETPVINSNSNGIPGNNYEPGATSQTDIKKILDYNSDTWFEYERVLEVEDNVPLILDFTVNIGKTEIVNFIRINPNNFGTKTELEVQSIQTSVDGKTYYDIKECILASDLVKTDRFSLAPSTSKYAGQGVYSFVPRKARFVRFCLRQSTAYPIFNSKGKQLLRYAIGIRDIYLEARPYKESGELISKAFETSDPIRKILLISNQDPEPTYSSPFGTIEHFVSPDNGVSWLPIRPRDSDGNSDTTQDISELIDFNGVDKNTVATNAPVTSLRYKVKMKRNGQAFATGALDADSSKARTAIATELYDTPSATPLEFVLQHEPIDGTVTVIDPCLGSRGLADYRYSTRTPQGGDTLKIRLPWRPLQRKLVKTWASSKWHLDEQIAARIYVDGIEWSQGKISGASTTSKYFQLDHNNGILEFGGETDGSGGTVGKAVPGGALVEVCFDEERLFPSSDTSHLAELEYSVASDSEEVEVYQVDKATVKTIVLDKGAKVHRLLPNLDSTYSVKFSDIAGCFVSEITPYVDGSVELTGTGEYSVDYENGIVYSYDRSKPDADTSCTFQYFPRTKLPSDGFSFEEGVDVSHSISISQAYWKTQSPDYPEAIPASVKYFNLANLSIVEDSLIFAGTGYSSVFSKEVAFVDGRTELLGVLKATEKLNPITVVAPGVQTITLRLRISSATDLDVGFSNKTAFASERSDPAEVTVPGRYYIYRTPTNPRVIVYLSSSVADPGTITYYYEDPNSDLSGAYSVNYDTGEVYTRAATTSGLTVTYRYSDYRVRYPIARQISPDDFTVDTKNKKVTLKDREIFKKSNVEKSSTKKEYYRITYKYIPTIDQDIKDLETFWTPSQIDYTIKAITESKLA